ncbi:MAG: hypothetical protein IKC80_00495 [Kiritimatiellae bacterium]|nr:hypothetical protein [Kiritimatiellia bacterium]
MRPKCDGCPIAGFCESPEKRRAVIPRRP